MREVITLQVGQAGNQLGWRFWDVALREHALPGASVGVGSFFREAEKGFSSGGGGGPGAPPLNLRARAVLVDTEEGVVSQLRRSPLRSLFDASCSVTDVSGAGNNWAHGYACYGPHHRTRLVDTVRVALESCESPQAFFLLHSLGGGTGSGLGSYLLEALADEFPEPFRITASLLPSDADDVVTSPYNALLATSRLVEAADCVLPIENQALNDAVAAAGRGYGGSGSPRGMVARAAASPSTPPRTNDPSDAHRGNEKEQGGESTTGGSSAPASPAFLKLLSAADDVLRVASAAVAPVAPPPQALTRQKLLAAPLSQGSKPPAALATAVSSSTRGGVSSRSAAVRLGSSVGGGSKAQWGARHPPPSAAASRTSVSQRLLTSPEGKRASAAAAAAVSAARGGGVSSFKRGGEEKGEVTDSRVRGGIHAPPPPVDEKSSLSAAVAAAWQQQQQQQGGESALRYSPINMAAEEAAPPSLPPAAGRSSTPWDSANDIVARLLCDLTAGMRFTGTLNLDIAELATTLVPFPRTHFLTTALSPLPRPPPSGRGTAGDGGVEPRGLDALVADAFARTSMLIRGNLRQSLNLACGLMLRGKSVAMSDAVHVVRRLHGDLPLAQWSTDGFKLALCAQRSVFTPDTSVLVASNNCGVASPLRHLYSNFLALYRVRAHLHHYLEYIDGDTFQEAAVAVDSVVKEYEELQRQWG